MKTLIVVRHAKSSWDEPELSDFKRPLNERGKKDAPRMAKRLKEKGIEINGVISSPAVRARDTCNVFVEVLGFPEEKVEWVKDLYHAGDEILLSVVRKLDDRLNAVMLFGHNPGLTEFVNNLAEEEIDNIPTTGIVCCRVKAKDWAGVKWGKGVVEFFDYPKKS